ncbi:MAG TPA: molybdopterin-dependent oxidoreductase [Caulobacteraceae bacterium]
MIDAKFSRRAMIGAGAAGLGGLLLAGCDRLSNSPKFQSFVGSAEDLTFPAQRALLAGQPLAREFPASMISPVFKSNGTSMPGSPAYKAMLERGFADFHLAIGGLVHRPTRFSFDELKAMPARTQITRHDCVEGWSAIGQWTGAPLARLLATVGLMPQARYAVFYCADDMDGSTDGSGQYYESIDLFDAFHPQTILAYGLNGKPLDAAHGAPLRLRVERQLGYKMAKYVMHIQLVDAVHAIKGGKGGYWEDRGYEWYAGI